MGQFQGPRRMTSGCIGHVYSEKNGGLLVRHRGSSDWLRGNVFAWVSLKLASVTGTAKQIRAVLIVDRYRFKAIDCHAADRIANAFCHAVIPQAGGRCNGPTRVCATRSGPYIGGNTSCLHTRTGQGALQRISYAEPGRMSPRNEIPEETLKSTRL